MKEIRKKSKAKLEKAHIRLRVNGEPVEVAFAMTESDSQRFLDLLAREMPSLFYIKSPCEFGRVGE